MSNGNRVYVLLDGEQKSLPQENWPAAKKRYKDRIKIDAEKTMSMTTETAAPTQDPGVAMAGMEGLAQGMTYGLSDELSGLAGAISGVGAELLHGTPQAVPDWKERYRLARNISREGHSAAMEHQPGATIVGEVGGAALTPGVPGTGAVSKGLAGKMAGPGAGAVKQRMAQKLASGATKGTAAGGLYGAGKAPELEDVPLYAGVGAATGAAVGSASGALGARATRLSAVKNAKMVNEMGKLQERLASKNFALARGKASRAEVEAIKKQIEATKVLAELGDEGAKSLMKRLLGSPLGYLAAAKYGGPPALAVRSNTLRGMK